MKMALILASVWIGIFCTLSSAGELFDDFILNEIDEDAWWVKTTGNATAEIKNGELILTSPDTADSIFLLYSETLAPKDPITVEIRMNLKTNIDDGWFGFLQGFPGDSHVNTLINPLKDATMFFAYGGGKQVQPRGEDGVKGGDASIKADEFHTFKIEVTADEYRMEIDEEEVHSGPRTDAKYIDRVFYISPDGFDSHYGDATYVVDWIRLTGPEIPQRIIAVEASGKLPIAWGKAKQLR